MFIAVLSAFSTTNHLTVLCVCVCVCNCSFRLLSSSVLIGGNDITSGISSFIIHFHQSRLKVEEAIHIHYEIPEG